MIVKQIMEQYTGNIENVKVSIKGYMLDTQKDLYYIMEDMFEDMVSDGVVYFFNDKELQNDLSKMNDFNSFRDIYYKWFGNDDIIELVG